MHRLRILVNLLLDPSSSLLNSLGFMAGLLGTVFGITVLLQLFPIGAASPMSHPELAAMWSLFLITTIAARSAAVDFAKFLRTNPPDSIFNQIPDLNTRLALLTKTLTEAGAVIASIEDEVNARKELVSRLEKERDIYQGAISLSKPQVDAVAQVLTAEVAKSESRSARRDYALFFGGVLASALVGLMLTFALRILSL